MDTNVKTDWIYCPICKKKTRDRVREDTVMSNFPLFCPKCKHECLVKINGFRMTVIEGKEKNL